MSGTFVTISADSMAFLLGAAQKLGKKIVPGMRLQMTDFKDLWYVCDYGEGGFIAVHMLRALSTGGLSIKSADKNKAQFAFEFTGHSSIANIVEDNEVINALSEILPEKDADNSVEKEEQDFLAAGVRMMGKIFKLFPLLLKKHRPDVYSILSVLEEKTVQEIAAQPAADILRQMRDVFQDIGLMDFFKSFAQRGKTEQSAPSADSPA